MAITANSAGYLILLVVTSALLSVEVTTGAKKEEKGFHVNKPISLAEDDELMKYIQMDLYMPDHNCYQLFGFDGEMYYVRSGLAMRGALKRVITVEPDVNQIQLWFTSRIKTILFEADVSVLNDTLGMLSYELIGPDGCDKSACASKNHISYNLPESNLGKITLNISCNDSPGGTVYLADNTYQGSTESLSSTGSGQPSPAPSYPSSSSHSASSSVSESSTTYSVVVKLNFTFGAFSPANSVKFESRTIMFTALKLCQLKPGRAVVSGWSNSNVKLKTTSVQVLLGTIAITLVLVLITSVAVSFYHLRASKPSIQSFKMNKNGGGGGGLRSHQQQRAALLMSGQFSESVLANNSQQLNYRSNSSSTAGGGGGDRSGNSHTGHSSQMLNRVGPGVCGGDLNGNNVVAPNVNCHLQQQQQQLNLHHQSQPQLPAEYSNVALGPVTSGHHSNMHLKLAGSNRSILMPNQGLAGSPVGGPGAGTLPAHLIMGGGMMNSSPATSGFLAPMHTAANSIGGGSGHTCMTPTTSEPGHPMTGSLAGGGSSALHHPLLLPEVALNNIFRNQISINELVLQGTFGLLHNASVAHKETSGDMSQHPVLVKTVKDQSSMDQIDTMLHECNVFATVSAADCAHILPCLTVVFGCGSNQSTGQTGANQDEDAEGGSGGSKYCPPPLVVYPQTAFGILKLHLRHLRSTRQSLTTRDIVGMGIQILHGLQFIVKSKLEFNDLATRNCFLDEGWVVKIGDAALARDLFPEDYQCLGDNVNRPIKWLAIEAISKYIYSPANDVWSFGITLWELWTLAETPYEDIDPFEMVSFLKEGGRLYQPQNCPDALYRCMCSCWAYDAVDRPNISKLIKYLQEFYTALGAFL